MAISSIGGAANSSLNSSRKTIAENFDTFLSMLTTQLKNQNPLDPLDTNQFTQQMVQFTSVEQQLKTNEFLEALVLNNRNNLSTDAVSFVGKQITASGSTSDLKNGIASWSFFVDRDAPEATITIRDASGSTVFSDKQDILSGTSTYSWDGRGIDGSKLPDGTYSITIDARDSNGVIPVSTKLTGVVESVDLSGNEPTLIVGGSRILMSSVESVGNP